MTEEQNKLEEARNYFKDDVFATKTAGIEIDEVGDHYAKCSMTIDSRHINAQGNVMGGAIFTIADFTFAVASNHAGDEKTVTLSSQITYIGKAKGKKLVSESRLIKNGRTICTYEILIKDELGNLVAEVISSGMKVG